MTRIAQITRETRETQIALTLDLDGTGQAAVATTLGSLDHMLESFARHGSFDLKVAAKGDTHVDQHHLVEDLGIVLGQAVSEALGERRGIFRAGFWHGAFVMPMDETAATVALDLGGRSYLNWQVEKFESAKVGELETAVIADFFEGFCQGARANVFIETQPARSDHHKIEAIFKAFGRALRAAVARDERNANEVPSTKGKIEG